MPNVALYYPYVHFRDESWLKVAALYWPRLARIVPRGYPTHDSDSVQMLRDELDAIVDLPPDMDTLAAVGDRFLRLVNDQPHALRERCNLQGLNPGVAPVREARLSSMSNPSYAKGAVAFVYASKMSYPLRDALMELELSAATRGSEWVGMHPDLARVYMCAVAEELSSRRGLHPATDQPGAFAATGTWDLDRIASVLLEQPSIRSMPAATSESIYDRFVIAALHQVIPANVSTVPMERIVEARKKAAHLLNDFREYAEQQVAVLAAAHIDGDVTLVADILAQIELTVASKLHVLERDLRKARLDVVPSLFSIKTALPALPLAAANAAHLSATVQGGVAVAAGVAWVARGMSTATTQVVENSPVGYLHSVRTSLKADTKVRNLLRTVWG